MIYFKAVHALVGGQISGPEDGPVSKYNFDDGQTPPTEKAIQAKLKELKDEYEKQAYARSRADAYDPIPEQLDQIYHDIDGWKARIKAVKDKYPKP
jgi:hypothetical protein